MQTFPFRIVGVNKLHTHIFLSSPLNMVIEYREQWFGASREILLMEHHVMLCPSECARPQEVICGEVMIKKDY